MFKQNRYPQEDMEHPIINNLSGGLGRSSLNIFSDVLNHEELNMVDN